jgi:hypothetical protein
VTDTVVPTFTSPVIVILEEPNDTGNGLEKLTAVFPAPVKTTDCDGCGSGL